ENRATPIDRLLHVVLPAHLHVRPDARPRGLRRAPRNVTRHHLVGRRLRAGTYRSRFPSTRKPDTRPSLADEIPAAAGRVRGHLMRPRDGGDPLTAAHRGDTTRRSRCQGDHLKRPSTTAAKRASRSGVLRRIACRPVPNTDPLERRTDERVFDREPEKGGRGLYGRARARDRGAVRAQAPRLQAPWHLLSAV